MKKRIPFKRVKAPKKRKRLKYIAILPSLVTLMNGLCGFIAILLSSQGAAAWQPQLLPGFSVPFFALAAYMVFFGMIADVLDGHVARISQSTSSFGAQLDSLCDVISFGVAPAFLMIKLIETHSFHFQFMNPQFVIAFERAVYLIAIIYAMCAVIRLARFNVETKEDGAAELGFEGLPSPTAAGLVISLVIFQQDFLPKIPEWSGLSIHGFELAIIWVLPIITLLAGLLMVTRIPYPHMVNRLLMGKKRFSTFILVLFTILLTILNIQLAMLLGFYIFVIYGIMRWINLLLFSHKKKEQKPETSDE